MSIHNNTPSNTYIYIENLTVTYDSQTYPITNLYTNKKYIYFDLNSPQTLYLSDIRKKDENLIYIIKNINGNGIIINNELIRLVFDNFDPQGLVKKVEEVVDVSEKYKLELDSMSEDVESLSDKYKKDKSFNDIKESLNTSIINYNSLLINISTLLTNFLSDSVFTIYEKGQIQSALDDISNKGVETLAYADALMDLYCEYNEVKSGDDEVYQYKINMETLAAQFKVDLGKILESSEEKITKADVSFVYSEITNIIESLEGLKKACNNITFLGAGGTIPNEVYQANSRIDTLTTSFGELQESILGTMNNEKQEIESKFNTIRVIGNKTVDITNKIISAGGKLSQDEFVTLRGHTVDLNSAFSSIKGYYEGYYSNSSLSEESKATLKKEFETFENTHEVFTELIKTKLEDLDYSRSDRSEYSKALMEYRSARNTFKSKLFLCINEINNTLSSTTLKQIKEELQKQITELEGKVKSLENNYQDLLERISKLENN